MKNRQLVLAVRTPLAGVIVLAIAAKPLGATTILNPNDPTANFQGEGTQPFSPAPGVLTLRDTSSSEFISFFVVDNDAIAGTTLDVVATFRVTAGVPANALVGNRLAINDGVSKSAILECIAPSFVPPVHPMGIGLYSSGSPLDPASYPVFIEVDWTAPTTIRLRRWANGDGEIMEINGVAPSPRALLTADLAPAVTRSGATVEFGAASVEAECTVQYTAFRSELPLAGDFNADGVVDAADYVVWRKTEINGQQGYNTWRANFGRTAPSRATGSVSAAVPEPANLVLMLVAAVGLGLQRSRVAK